MRFKNLATWAVLPVIACLWATSAWGHDPEGMHTDWMAQQRNMRGWACCDGSDAVLLSEWEWGVAKKYRATHGGQVFDIEDWQLVDSEWGGPNPTKKGVLWLSQGSVRCFTPGTLM